MESNLIDLITDIQNNKNNISIALVSYQKIYNYKILHKLLSKNHYPKIKWNKVLDIGTHVVNDVKILTQIPDLYHDDYIYMSKHNLYSSAPRVRNKPNYLLLEVSDKMFFSCIRIASFYLQINQTNYLVEYCNKEKPSFYYLFYIKGKAYVAINLYFWSITQTQSFKDIKIDEVITKYSSFSGHNKVDYAYATIGANCGILNYKYSPDENYFPEFFRLKKK